MTKGKLRRKRFNKHHRHNQAAEEAEFGAYGALQLAAVQVARAITGGRRSQAPTTTPSTAIHSPDWCARDCRLQWQR
jgi:hypothetical protein